MELSKLEPWKSLTNALKNKVKVALNETQRLVLPVYGQGEMPNTGLGEGFILIANNGVIQNLTYPYSMFRGSVAITVYVKANPEGTIKAERIRSAVSQIEKLVNDYVSEDGYFFKFSADNIITPYTVNAANGYSMTVLRAEWRTTR